LSLYQLTIEHGTRFAELHARGGLRGLPPDDRAAEMYEVTQQVTAAAGMPAYEVSNHARPGSESRHNLIYWRYGDYVGVGPGAHGRITQGIERIATETLRAPADWMTAAETGSGIRTEPLPDGAAGDEYALMSLRLTEGMDLARYHSLSSQSLNRSKLAQLTDQGLVEQRAGRVAATRLGRPLLNAIIADLLT